MFSYVILFIRLLLLLFLSLCHVHMWESLCSISSLETRLLTSSSWRLLEHYYSHHIVSVLVLIFVSLKGRLEI